MAVGGWDSFQATKPYLNAPTPSVVNEAFREAGLVSLRELLDAVRVRWRRWRLLRAYSKVFEAKTGKGVGFTPIMAAYERAEDDGVLSRRRRGHLALAGSRRVARVQHTPGCGLRIHNARGTVGLDENLNQQSMRETHHL